MPFRTVYEACFFDTPCGHAHHTRETAERCVRKILWAARRAVRRGTPFAHPADSSRLARLDPGEAFLYVRKQTWDF